MTIKAQIASRTVVIAPTHDRAIDYCATHGIDDALIITTANLVRGRRLASEHVVFTDPPDKYRDLPRLVAAIKPCGVTFPDGFLQAAFQAQ